MQKTGERYTNDSVRVFWDSVENYEFREIPSRVMARGDNSYPTEWYIAVLESGKTVAVAMVEHSWWDEGVLVLQHLAVLASFRRRGIGTRLIESIRAGGHTVVASTVGKSVTEFYCSRGFHVALSLKQFAEEMHTWTRIVLGSCPVSLDDMRNNVEKGPSENRVAYVASSPIDKSKFHMLIMAHGM